MTIQIDQNELIGLISEKYNVDKEHIQLVVGEEYSDEVHDMVPTVEVRMDTSIDFRYGNCGGSTRYINQ